MKNIFFELFHKTKKTFQKIQEKVEKLQQMPSEVLEESKLETIPVSPERVIFEVSPVSVAKSTIVILLLLGLAYFLRTIGDILVIFFVAFLLAAAMEPAVDYLQKKKIPRGLGVIVFYILTFAVLGVVISYVFPLLARQLSELAGKLGGFIQNISHLPSSQLPFSASINRSLSQFLASLNIQEFVTQLENDLQGFAGQLLAFGGNLWEVIKFISNGLINTVLVLMLGFFMTVERNAIHEFILSLFPLKHAQYAADRIVIMKKKIGSWLRAQLILMVVLGVSVYIGLSILGVQYAAALAILTGLLEIIPVLGPLLSWLIALPIVANQSGWLVLWVTLVYGLVQQVEGHILVPIIMKRAIGLSTIVVIFALLVGARLMGVLGIVLSVPVATMLSIFVEDYLGRRSNKPSR